MISTSIVAIDSFLHVFMSSKYTLIFVKFRAGSTFFFSLGAVNELRDGRYTYINRYTSPWLISQTNCGSWKQEEKTWWKYAFFFFYISVQSRVTCSFLQHQGSHKVTTKWNRPSSYSIWRFNSWYGKQQPSKNCR